MNATTGSPFLGMLLHMSNRQAWDERVRRPRLGDNLASVKVEDDRFDALRSGINADEEGHRINDVAIQVRAPQNTWSGSAAIAGIRRVNSNLGRIFRLPVSHSA